MMHVFNELRPSGAEVILLDSLDLWYRHGYAIEVVAKAANEGPFAQQFRDRGVVVHHIDPTTNEPLVPRLTRLFSQRAPDVVHIHAESHSTGVAISAKRARVRRVVRTVHAPFTTSRAGQTKRVLQRFFVRRIGIKMVAVSETVAANELDRFYNPCRVVTNGADLSRFQPPTDQRRRSLRESLGLSDHLFPVAISVANCAPVKNHEEILRALNHVPNCYYLHVGEEDPDGRERRLAEELGVADRVLFAGPQSDVSVWLQAADVYVMPSTYEGLPLAALEALACGLPAVLAPVGGLLEISAPGLGIAWADRAQGIVEQLRALPPASSGKSLDDLRERFSLARAVASYADIYS